jgi:hypothetical protein
MSSAEIFREITAALDQARIPYMVVGSFASNLYGTGRGTQDIDLVVSATPDQIRLLLSLLTKPNYYFDLDAALEACQRGIGKTISSLPEFNWVRTAIHGRWPLTFSIW